MPALCAVRQPQLTLTWRVWHYLALNGGSGLLYPSPWLDVSAAPHCLPVSFYMPAAVTGVAVERGGGFFTTLWLRLGRSILSCA